MPMMETPLLASQDVNDSEPLLSLGPYVEAEDDPSPLERIIAETAGTSPLIVVPHDHPIRASASLMQTPASDVARSKDARFLISVIAGCLWLLHCGLVWGSYATDSWSDTHLRATLDWSFIPNSGVDVVLRSMNLASVFLMLKASKDEILIWLVFLSALVVPCMMTLLFPMWISNDHSKNGTNKSSSSPCQLARIGVESSIRLGFAVVYHFLLLDLVMYPLEWNWTGTTVQIQNQARGGFISYVLGITAALLLIIVLRAARSDAQLSFMRSGIQEDYSAVQNNERSADIVLINGDANFDLYAIDHDSTEPSSSAANCSWLKRFLALQIGLASFLLWVPAMALPMFRVTYGGLISNLMEKASMQVYMWEIPYLLWKRGMAAGTDQWMLLVLGTMLMLTVLILPLLLWWLACCFWVVSDIAKSRSLRKCVFLVQPATCGIMFAVMSIQTIRKISVLGNYLFDEVTSATICKYSKSVMDEPCLTVAGELNAGVWYLLAQAIVLETFVWITLWFSP